MVDILNEKTITDAELVELTCREVMSDVVSVRSIVVSDIVDRIQDELFDVDVDPKKIKEFVKDMMASAYGSIPADKTPYSFAEASKGIYHPTPYYRQIMAVIAATNC